MPPNKSSSSSPSVSVPPVGIEKVPTPEDRSRVLAERVIAMNPSCWAVGPRGGGSVESACRAYGRRLRASCSVMTLLATWLYTYQQTRRRRDSISPCLRYVCGAAACGLRVYMGMVVTPTASPAASTAAIIVPYIPYSTGRPLANQRQRPAMWTGVHIQHLLHIRVSTIQHALEST